MMSTLTVQLPESLKKTIEALAAKEGRGADNGLFSARSLRWTPPDSDKYLTSVPDAPPQPGNELQLGSN